MSELLRNRDFPDISHLRAGPPPSRIVTRNAVMAENKIPLPHRLYLVDGRVIDGYLYRGISSRLVDELYGQKGSFVSVVDARCATTGQSVAYMAVNQRHIITIEELSSLPPLET